MIQELRRKFVLISVAVLAGMMLLIAAVINTANWISVQNDIADTAKTLVGTSIDDEYEHFANRRHGKHNESIYESRYFTVSFEHHGIETELSNVSSYTETDAKSMAETVMARNSDTGFIDECYYVRSTDGDETNVLFLDCGSKFSAVRSLLWISLVSCGVGIIAAWLLMTLLSKRAVAPVIENTNRQKRFITDASHELKTPLSVISANMEVMAMDDPENEWVISTRRQTGLMTRMVNDMVFLARSDEGVQRSERIEFDLSRLVRDTSEPFVMMAEAGGRVLRIDTPEKMKICGDSKGIERLISVLCDNALKYSAEKDTMKLQLTEKGNFAVIETDNVPAGPVPAEKLKHFFERFYRADEARTKNSGRTGSGIGLAIALAVCEAHGGDAKAFLQDGRVHIQCRLRLKG